jgi:hypothetical protein
MLARRGKHMGTGRTVTMLVLAALTALTACSDGGPPSPFHHPGTRDAPSTAADGGTDLSDGDAGEE